MRALRALVRRAQFARTPFVMDTLAQWLRRRPAKPMGVSPRRFESCRCRFAWPRPGPWVSAVLQRRLRCCSAAHCCGRPRFALSIIWPYDGHLQTAPGVWRRACLVMASARRAAAARQAAAARRNSCWSLPRLPFGEPGRKNSQTEPRPHLALGHGDMGGQDPQVLPCPPSSVGGAQGS